MDKKVLVIGKGHIGTYIKDSLNLPDEQHWKGLMSELTVDKLEEIAPQIIINASGKTDLHWCEDNENDCYNNNVYDPLFLYNKFSNICSYMGYSGLYIHLSTGCSWDGPYNKLNGKAFGPNDRENPACIYSKSKVDFDRIISGRTRSTFCLEPYVILRPRLVYSHKDSPRNTLKKINSYPKLLTTPNSMTSIDTIVKTVKCLIKDSTECKNKIMCVYDKGIITPYDVGCILNVHGHRDKPEKMTKEELDGWHKPKRVDVVMYDELFERIVNPPNVFDEVNRIAKLFKKGE